MLQESGEESFVDEREYSAITNVACKSSREDTGVTMGLATWQLLGGD